MGQNLFVIQTRNLVILNVVNHKAIWWMISLVFFFFFVVVVHLFVTFSSHSTMFNRPAHLCRPTLNLFGLKSNQDRKNPGPIAWIIELDWK